MFAAETEWPREYGKSLKSVRSAYFRVCENGCVATKEPVHERWCYPDVGRFLHLIHKLIVKKGNSADAQQFHLLSGYVFKHKSKKSLGSNKTFKGVPQRSSLATVLEDEIRVFRKDIHALVYVTVFHRPAAEIHRVLQTLAVGRAET